MPEPFQFSIRRMLSSVTSLSIGSAAITFGARKWNLPLNRAYDDLARVEPLARLSALVIGWALVCIGVILLTPTRRPAVILSLALVGVIPGAFIGVILDAFAWGTLFEGRSIQIGMGAWVVSVFGGGSHF